MNLIEIDILIGSVNMNDSLTASQRIIRDNFNSYLIGMNRLHDNGVYDEIASDIEDFSAVTSLIAAYIRGEEFIKEDLFTYFGDSNRAELVESYFNIARDLLANGATLSL